MLLCRQDAHDQRYHQQQVRNNTFYAPSAVWKNAQHECDQVLFEDAGTSADGKPSRARLFDGFKIMDAGEKYTSQMGKYPVIYLTFKDAKRETFEEAYTEILYEIAHEVSRHRFLLDAPELQNDKEQLEMLIGQKADKTVYGKAIRFLSKCLERYYGKRRSLSLTSTMFRLKMHFRADSMIKWLVLSRRCLRVD